CPSIPGGLEGRPEKLRKASRREPVGPLSHLMVRSSATRAGSDYCDSSPSVRSNAMSKNRGVVYVKPGLVEVRDIADPKFEDPHGRKINHAVILNIVSTNICGSDQHMVRGRTTAPAGLVLGHEITGEVIEKGVDVEFIDVGDIVSVPIQRRVWALPYMPRGGYWRLPHCKPWFAWWGLRLCG